MSNSKVLVMSFGDQKRISKEDQQIVSTMLCPSTTDYFYLQPHDIGDFERFNCHTPEMVDEVLSAISTVRYEFARGNIRFEDVATFEDIENLIVYFDSTVSNNFLESQELLEHVVPHFAGALIIRRRVVSALKPDTPTSMLKLNQGWLLTRDAKVF